MDIETSLKLAVDQFKMYEVMIDERLPKAQTGDRQATLSLLSVAAGLISTGLPVPPKMAEWLSLGLQGLATGLTPEESFGFAKRGRGERTSATVVRITNDRFRRAYFVEYLARAKEMSIQDACHAVASVECVNVETVNMAWDADHQRAKTVLAVSWGDMYWAREIK